MSRSYSKGGARSAQNSGGRVLVGTNGDDHLVGTSRNDVFFPLLCHDEVDGRGGRDTLVVDYSDVAPGFFSPSSMIVSTGGSFSGQIWASDSANDVSFTSIENLLVGFDDGDNVVSLDGAALAHQAELVLDGNGGTDTLEADFSALSGPTNFRVAGNGTIATNRGHYYDFENLVLTLGNGADRIALGAGDDSVFGGGGNDDLDGGAGNDRLYGNAGRNRLSGGAGDDLLTSTGVDRVRGGDGDDEWVGIFVGASQSLNFTFDGSTGAGALSNGVTLEAIENLDVRTGSGNDSFDLTGLDGSAFVYGGAGTNSLTVTTSGVSEFLPFHFSTIRSDGAGALAGDVAGTDFAFTAFSGIDHLTYTAGDDNDSILVDAAALVGGVTLWVDAAGGSDMLILDRLAFEDTTFIVAPDGSISGNVPGTYLNFESYSLVLGNGTNVVTTGAGDDSIEAGSGDDSVASGDGNDFIRVGAGVNVVDAGGGDDWITSSGHDTIDGGDGYDMWQADHFLETENLTITIAGGTGTFSNGVSFANVEHATIAIGSGDDVISVTGPGIANVYAEGGIDTLTVDHSASTDWGATTLIYSAESTFNGSFSASDAGTGFAGIEHLTYTATAFDDVTFLDAAALLAGATLALDAGGGQDMLEVDFTAFGDVHFEADGAGNVTSNVGSFSSFERFSIRSGEGDDYLVTASANDTLSGGGGSNVLISGAGDDEIWSSGVDQVDGGDGFDRLTMNSDDPSSLVFTYDGNSGFLSNGTQFTSIEMVSVGTGSGDDIFNLSGTANGSFNGGGFGVDTLNADFSGPKLNEGPDDSQITVWGEGELDGILNGQCYFYMFDNIDLVATDADSRIFVDFRQPFVGTTLACDGGLGNDTLFVTAYWFSDDLLFSVESDGSSTNNLGLTTANFERYVVATGNGDDVIAAGDGDDVIFGGEGDDILEGGAGADDLEGWFGADTFLFESLGDFSDGPQLDNIRDFSAADGDLIDLTEIDADADAAGDQTFSFIGDAAFSGNGSGAELRYVTDGFDTHVEGDIDGDGAADFTIFVANVQSLVAADFVL